MGCFSSVCHSEKYNKSNKEGEKIKVIYNDKIISKIAAAKNTYNYNFDNMNLTDLNFLNRIFPKSNKTGDNNKDLIIKVFSANNNNIDKIPKEFFKNITKIVKIDFSFNQIKEIEYEICNKTTLKFLSLNNNKITDIPNNFNNLKNLKELNLSNNLLNKNIVSETLFNLDSLEILNLSHNKIKDFPINLLLNQKLMEINLSYNSIENNISNDYWSKTNLQNLDLSFNNLTVNNLSQNIFFCSNVSILNLKGNKIKLEELKHIKGFEKFVERRKQRKDQAFLHNLAINFDFCGLD